MCSGLSGYVYDMCSGMSGYVYDMWCWSGDMFMIRGIGLGICL